MPEANIPNFQAAHDLAERLYNLQKDQADRMLDMLTNQGRTLGELVTDMAVVKEQTKEVPTLKERIATLEQFKWKIAGWVSAAFILAWALDHMSALHTLFGGGK
jgi:hypothetical protein